MSHFSIILIKFIFFERSLQFVFFLLIIFHINQLVLRCLYFFIQEEINFPNDEVFMTLFQTVLCSLQNCSFTWLLHLFLLFHPNPMNSSHVFLKVKMICQWTVITRVRAVFPNLFWFAAPLLSFVDFWRHPWMAF